VSWDATSDDLSIVDMSTIMAGVERRLVSRRQARPVGRMGTRELNYGNARVVRLGGPLVSAHLLVDEVGMTLVDTGLWGVAAELRRVVARMGRRPDELRDIVLTHGHLDHVGGAAEIRAWSGARVRAHAADREHVAQRVRYAGASRVCGWLERTGRVTGGLRGWSYRAPEIDGELQGGVARLGRATGVASARAHAGALRAGGGAGGGARAGVRGGSLREPCVVGAPAAEVFEPGFAGGRGEFAGVGGVAAGGGVALALRPAGAGAARATAGGLGGPLKFGPRRDGDVRVGL
jgi:hypothetical protein